MQKKNMQKKSAPGFWVTLKEATTCSITNRNLIKGERVFFLPQQGVVGQHTYKKMRKMKNQNSRHRNDTLITLQRDTTCTLSQRPLKKNERVFFIPSFGVVGEKEYLEMRKLKREKKLIAKSTYDIVIERGED